MEGSATEGAGSVERLCEMLSHRDATIQRLEEDLLRIRMVGEANLSNFFFYDSGNGQCNIVLN